MSTYVTKKYHTETKLEDLRQVAEGEAVAGPKSIQALPGSIALGEGARLTIKDAGTKEQVASMNSIIGNLLGIQSQMAQGIFELAPAVAAEMAAQEIGTGLTDVGTQFGIQAKEPNKLILATLIGLGFLFFIRK